LREKQSRGRKAKATALEGSRNDFSRESGYYPSGGSSLMKGKEQLRGEVWDRNSLMSKE
jgi:hypothetical protein